MKFEITLKISGETGSTAAEPSAVEIAAVLGSISKQLADTGEVHAEQEFKMMGSDETRSIFVHWAGGVEC